MAGTVYDDWLLVISQDRDAGRTILYGASLLPL